MGEREGYRHGPESARLLMRDVLRVRLCNRMPVASEGGSRISVLDMRHEERRKGNQGRGGGLRSHSKKDHEHLRDSDQKDRHECPQQRVDSVSCGNTTRHAET